MCEIILAGFKFGNFLQNCQFAKLKTSLKFLAIRQLHLISWHDAFNVQCSIVPRLLPVFQCYAQENENWEEPGDKDMYTVRDR